MHWNNTVFTKPERWKCGPSLKQHWVNAPRCTCVTEQFKLTGQVTRSERVFTNTMRHRPNRFFFFFFFFQDMIPSWKWTRKDCFSDIAFIEGDVKHPIFTVWRLLTSDSDVRSRQTEKERNAKTVAIATHPLSTMRFHRSLCIFVIILTHFSLISHSILNRFSCNFAGAIGRYYGNFPINMAKFDRVLQKVLMRLLWNLLEYFQKLFILTSIQTSILNRLPCNFAGSIGRYYGNRPVNLAKFA